MTSNVFNILSDSLAQIPSTLAYMKKRAEASQVKQNQDIAAVWSVPEHSENQGASSPLHITKQVVYKGKGMTNIYGISEISIK